VRPTSAFVTGATGLVGSSLVRRLDGAGHAVHALARASSDRRVLSGRDVTWHAGDLRDADAVRRAVEAWARAARGAELRPVCIHAGARISYRTADRELQRLVNVEGTRHVLEACREQGVARLVHVSSVVTVGVAGGPGEALDEDAPFDAGALRSDYVDTKREAEELVAAAELDHVIVNPGAIYGLGPRISNTTRFLQVFARSLAARFAPPGSLSVVGIDDVVEGLLLALERGRRGRRYILTESNHTVRGLYELCARELGVAPPLLTLPRALWRCVLAGARAVDAVRPAAFATPQALGLLGAHLRFDASRARAELGWRPEPFVDVLRATIGWMRATGLLAGRSAPKSSA